MKVVCNRESLLSAFQLATAVIPSKDVKPVLSNLKAVVGKEGCTLLATDLELGIRLEIRGVEVAEPGEALLPGARMLAIVREATDESLTIEADEQKCFVRGDTNEFEMGGEDPAEYPDVPMLSGEQYHTFQAGALREMIRRTVFAAATENPRYALTGVLWELDGDTVRLVATDGRRLALVTGTAKGQGGHGTQGQTNVVPTKAMQLLERNLQDAEEEVRVSLQPNEALFRTDRATIYSRLVEGRYPPYREIFPKKQTAKIALVAGPFYSAVRQAAIMTDDDSKRVTFVFGKKKVTLQAHGREAGRSKVELPIEYDGKTIEIALDPKFLGDMLRVLNPEDPLIVELLDANSVALFRQGDQYSYIIMPLA